MIPMSEVVTLPSKEADIHDTHNVKITSMNSMKARMPENALSKDVTITNGLGLHARPAARIAQAAQQAKSDVLLSKGDQEADAKSIIDILTLACEPGTRLTVKVQEQSDLNVLCDIVQIMENGFGE
jgi:phosphocarrier protein